MELSVHALRDRLDSFLFELGSLQYRYGAGLSSQFPAERLYASFSELSRAESYLAIREAAEKRSTDEQERRRMRMLLEFIAGQVEEGLSAEAIEAIARTEGQATVLVQNQHIPFRDALAQLTTEDSRQRRAELELALGKFLNEQRGPYIHRREAAFRTAETLKAGSYLQLRDELSGFSAKALAAEAEGVLKQTEDAYRDVLGYVLKKLDPQLRPLPSGNARRHDILRASVAPWLFPHFRREDLFHAVTRCLGDMGFHPNAEGRIQLDLDDRPGKSSRAFVADLRVPDDIRLVVRPLGGIDDYFSLLHEYGHALHLANINRRAPVEERRLGDPSVIEANASLFDHFLLDEGWLKRYLRLPSSVASDSARVAAFNNLVLLRRYCAKLSYELSLYERGPSDAVAEEYEERLTHALFVGVERGFFLYDVDPQLYAARYLRAWALEARFHEVLQNRFNEDYWRNPAAGTWLKNLSSQGQREDAASLAKTLTGAELRLADAGQRLIRVM
ncbi:MAG: peptidase M3 [Myxococcaceae bacterium]